MGAQHRRAGGDTLVDHLSQPVKESLVRTAQGQPLASDGRLCKGALRVAQAFIPEGERFADLRHDRLPIRGAIRSASNATRWAAPVGIPGSATMATPSKASFLSSRPPLNSFRSTLRCGSMKSWKIGAFRHSFHCGRLQDFRVCEPTLCRLTSGGRRSRCIGTGSRRQDA